MFLYLLPEADTETPLPELFAPLGDRFRDLATPRLWQLHGITRRCYAGPAGASGLIVAVRPPGDQSADERVGYFPDRQQWMPLGNGAWLGWEPERLPGPEALARLKQISGYRYELGDGADWECPTLRYPAHPPRPNLPEVFGVDDQGNFVTRLSPDWEWAWELAGECWDIFTQVRETVMAENWQYCVQLLGINYRIGPQEVSVLGLLNSDNYGAVFKSAIDGPRIEAFLNDPDIQEQLAQLDEGVSKKNEPPEPMPPPESSSPGARDNFPDTVPAAANCS